MVLHPASLDHLMDPKSCRVLVTRRRGLSLGTLRSRQALIPDHSCSYHDVVHPEPEFFYLRESTSAITAQDCVPHRERERGNKSRKLSQSFLIRWKWENESVDKDA